MDDQQKSIKSFTFLLTKQLGSDSSFTDILLGKMTECTAVADGALYLNSEEEIAHVDEMKTTTRKFCAQVGYAIHFRVRTSAKSRVNHR